MFIMGDVTHRVGSWERGICWWHVLCNVCCIRNISLKTDSPLVFYHHQKFQNCVSLVPEIRHLYLQQCHWTSNYSMVTLTETCVTQVCSVKILDSLTNTTSCVYSSWTKLFFDGTVLCLPVSNAVFLCKILYVNFAQMVVVGFSIMVVRR
jgi:hypothetical protein